MSKIKNLTATAACAAMLGGSALAQTPSHLGMHRVAPDVYVYTDGDPSGKAPATTNSLVVVTSEGVLVGDGLGSTEATQQMIDAIKKITNQPIKYLVNASWHGDHTNGNHLFKDAVIIAHETAREDLVANYRQNPNPQVPQKPPTVVYNRSMTLFLGGKEIRLGFHGRGHTRGDTAIYLPAERVAFLTELFFNKQFPGLRSGYPAEWIATLNEVMKLNADVWIPGHGVLENNGKMRSHLVKMRDELVEMRNEIKGYADRGLKQEDIMKMSPLKKFASLINAERNLPIAVDRILKDLRGELDRPSN